MTTTSIEASRDPVRPSARPQDPEEGWASVLLSSDSRTSAGELAGRVLSGLALAALYGLAIGARQGGMALLQHAVGVPLGLLLVALMGAPSIFVFLSLCRAPIDGHALASTGARGIARAGLILAGLAPAALLFVVSSETPHAAAGAVLVGLLLGGGVSLATTTLEILRGAAKGNLTSIAGGLGVSVGFAAFAVLLAARVWSALLPVLGGAS